MKKYLPTVLATCMIASSAFANEESREDDVTMIEFVEKVGRDDEEYFFTPIVGLYYTDITGLSQSFFKSNDPDISINNNVNATKTDLGAVVGLLIDGQYQIVSTDYWRAGFQAGFIYATPSKTEFQAYLCDSGSCPNNMSEYGTLKTSSFEIPLLFTVARYAENDDWITTFKLGPTLVHNKYELEDFEGFELQPTNENEIIFSVGLDARYRLEESDTFLLMGFLVTNIFGSNNSQFSGVDSFGNFSTYIGLSFS